MEVKTFRKETKVTIVRTVDVIELETNFNVLRYTEETVSEGGTVLKTNVQEGFCLTKSIAAFKRGAGSFMKTPYQIMSKEGRELYRQFGWNLDMMAKNIRRTDKFDFFALEGGTLDDLVEIDTGCHMIKDRHGKFVAGAIHGEYSRAYIHNGRYDLEKAAAILLARKDVVVLKANDVTWREGPGDKPATTVKEAIIAVPSYNSERNRTYYIDFLWMPSDEDYAAVIKYASDNETKYNKITSPGSLWEAIFYTDALGLRVANYQQGVFHGIEIDRPGYAEEIADEDDDRY